MRVGGSISQRKWTHLVIPQGGVLSVTLFLAAINGILGELGNGVDDHSLQMIWQYTLQQEWHLKHCKEGSTSWMHRQQRGV